MFVNLLVELLKHRRKLRCSPDWKLKRHLCAHVIQKVGLRNSTKHDVLKAFIVIRGDLGLFACLGVLCGGTGLGILLNSELITNSIVFLEEERTTSAAKLTLCHDGNSVTKNVSLCQKEEL